MLEIITDPKTLTRKSKRVSSIDDTIRNICISLINTMINNNGIGIAAPQCGILKRIIIIHTEDEGPISLINPEIISVSKEVKIDNEGCLSIPNKFFKKERPIEVKVKYRNYSGKPVIRVFTGLESRIVLHEIDHLNGIILSMEDKL